MRLSKRKEECGLAVSHIRGQPFCIRRVGFRLAYKDLRWGILTDLFNETNIRVMYLLSNKQEAVGCDTGGE